MRLKALPSLRSVRPTLYILCSASIGTRLRREGARREYRTGRLTPPRRPVCRYVHGRRSRRSIRESRGLSRRSSPWSSSDAIGFVPIHAAANATTTHPSAISGRRPPRTTAALALKVRVKRLQSAGKTVIVQRSNGWRRRLSPSRKDRTRPHSRNLPRLSERRCLG